MAYEVLYRRWRSKGFDELVGQEHVRQALTHALSSKRLHHAYLFTGTRGVGKTTVARIFARCLNCEVGVSAAPCGECTNCKEILDGRFVDLIEVDAASRTGVDDMRELLENLQYAPVRGRYKVYLIDEVHMLSGHSFNALLKSLEEPPPWVIFLLATTEPKRLPVTVLSRCLQFALKSFSAPTIAGHLAHVLAQEQVEYEQEALTLIARAARGSMRDALSLTDQAIVHGGGALSSRSVAELLGTLDQDAMSELADALVTGSAEAMVKVSAHIEEAGGDYEEALASLTSALHAAAVAKALNQPAASAIEQRLAHGLSADEIQLMYQFAIMGARDLVLAPEPKLGFEMTLLRMLAFRPDDSASPVDGDASGSGSVHVTKAERANPRPATPPRGRTTSAGARAPNTLASATGVSVAAAKAPATVRPPLVVERQVNTLVAEAADWHALVDRLDLGGAARELVWNCAWAAIDGDVVTLRLHESQRSLLTNERLEQATRALSSSLARDVRVAVVLSGDNLETPASRRAAQARAQHEAAVTYLRSHPHVRSLIDRFGGELDEGSVKP